MSWAGDEARNRSCRFAESFASQTATANGLSALYSAVVMGRPITSEVRALRDPAAFVFGETNLDSKRSGLAVPNLREVERELPMMPDGQQGNGPARIIDDIKYEEIAN